MLCDCCTRVNMKLMWILVLMASTYGTIKLIDNNWKRYNENPTVIAIQKNYRAWSVRFPAATFCFIDNLDVSRAKQFIYDQWKIKPDPEDEYEEGDDFMFDQGQDNVGSDYSNIDINGTTTEASTTDGVESKFKYYLNFLRTLVNTTYENLDKFKQYEHDETLSNLNVEDTILKVMREYSQNSTFYTDDFNDREFFLTPTEMGMCYVHGGKLADYITLSKKPEIRHNLQIPFCSFNTLCYARTEGTPSDIRYYIHSPYEIPDISSPWFLVKGRMGRDVSFLALETTISPQIHDLSPSQRKCRFMFESISPHVHVYSLNLCRMQCRKELAFKYCGCAPYFYMKEDAIPVCSIKGLSCLSKHSEILITLRNGTAEKPPCFCLPPCSDTKYFVDKDVVYQWTFPAPYDIRFRWAIEKSNKIRIQRDVIFTFEDLVGSFGGIAALFLGCSILSFIEIIYFFTIRLYWYFVNK